MLITELKNDLPKISPVKEIMSIYIDKINPNIPNRNGFIYALIGSPGSGKSSLLLSLFRSKNYYKRKQSCIYQNQILKLMKKWKQYQFKKVEFKERCQFNNLLKIL